MAVVWLSLSVEPLLVFPRVTALSALAARGS